MTEVTPLERIASEITLGKNSLSKGGCRLIWTSEHIANEERQYQ